MVVPIEVGSTLNPTALLISILFMIVHWNQMLIPNVYRVIAW